MALFAGFTFWSRRPAPGPGVRYQLNDRRRDMGLGPYPEITLA